MSSPFSLSVPLDSLQGKDWVELSALEQAAAIAVGSVNEYITFNTLLQLDHDTSNRFKVKHFKHLPPFRPLPAPLPAFLPASFSRCLFLVLWRFVFHLAQVHGINVEQWRGTHLPSFLYTLCFDTRSRPVSSDART